MKNKKINITKKELDRDLNNLVLPEIDWTEPATGYPEGWFEEIQKEKKKDSANK